MYDDEERRRRQRQWRIIQRLNAVSFALSLLAVWLAVKANF